MKVEDKKRFIQAMAIMAEAFQKSPSKGLSDIYWRVLADMGIADFERACLNLINLRKITGTFPLVAEIRDASVSGSLESKISTAWNKLLYAYENIGPYLPIAFDDPVITKIMEDWGGWANWSHGEISVKETRKEFEKLYKAYMHLDLPKWKRLPSLTEINNRAIGQKTPHQATVCISSEVIADLERIPGSSLKQIAEKI